MTIGLDGEMRIAVAGIPKTARFVWHHIAKRERCLAADHMN